MLLDDFLPVYDFHEVHTIAVQASTTHIFRTLKEVTLAELPLFRILLRVRALPSRLAGRREARLRRDQTLFEWSRASGFLLLAETVDQELVFGVIGQFWRLSGGSSPRIASTQEFLAFRDAGYVKVATNFYLGEGSRDGSIPLRTETRIYALDPTARRSFAAYWRLIYPGSALIRREWLLAVRRRAERN